MERKVDYFGKDVKLVFFCEGGFVSKAGPFTVKVTFWLKKGLYYQNKSHHPQESPVIVLKVHLRQKSPFAQKSPFFQKSTFEL